MGAVPCIEYTLQEHWSMPIHPEIFMAVVIFLATFQNQALTGREENNCRLLDRMHQTPFLAYVTKFLTAW